MTKTRVAAVAAMVLLVAFMMGVWKPTATSVEQVRTPVVMNASFMHWPKN